MESTKWKLKASCHTYITLYYDDKPVYCFDNDILGYEFIKKHIEKRTGVKFEEIKKEGEFTGFGEFGHSGEKYFRF